MSKYTMEINHMPAYELGSGYFAAINGGVYRKTSEGYELDKRFSVSPYGMIIIMHWDTRTVSYTKTIEDALDIVNGECEEANG